MDTLSIESEKASSIEQYQARLSPYWHVEITASNGLAVHGDTSRGYLHLEAPGRNGRWCLLLDYSDVELAKLIIEQIADSPDVVVDNDFGLILRGDEFVEKIRRNRAWNWRVKAE